MQLIVNVVIAVSGGRRRDLPVHASASQRFFGTRLIAHMSQPGPSQRANGQQSIPKEAPKPYTTPEGYGAPKMSELWLYVRLGSESSWER